MNSIEKDKQFVRKVARKTRMCNEDAMKITLKLGKFKGKVVLKNTIF
jgi:hypothetical protein